MFNLSAYLGQRRTEVETQLADLLPSPDTPPAVLHEAMHYAVFTGGKRLRPILSMAAAEACGAPHQAGLLPGCAVEILHTYTLVHDDLPCMDDDIERRGKPTVHIAFDESTAVLAGDALQTLAFELAARTPACGVRWHSADLVRELAFAAGHRGVVGGQVADLAVCDHTPTAEEITFIHAHKTADLFRATLRLGAMAADGTPAQVDALDRYARLLGIAFQITDDLLDAPADGSQPAEASLLSLVDADAARQQAEACITDAVVALTVCEPAGVEALEAIARYIPSRLH